VNTSKPEISKLPPILERVWLKSTSIAVTEIVAAIFDLDSTIYDLTLRIARIVDDFAQNPDYQKQFPRNANF